MTLPDNRFKSPIKGLEKRAIWLAKQTKLQMIEADIYSSVDDASLSLLGMHMARLEGLEQFELEPLEQLNQEKHLTATILRLRKDLGLSKDLQLRVQSARRGRGRPTTSDDAWSELDV